MAFVTVHTGGVYGDSNIYENREVVVIYWQEFVGWMMERGVVENGRVELEGPGPMTDQRYWVGIPYESTMKTFPLRGQGKVNPKSRISKVRLFLDKHSGEMMVEVGNEGGKSLSDTVRWKERKDGGVVDINVGTSYGEESYVKVHASGVEPVGILGIDAELQVYEE